MAKSWLVLWNGFLFFRFWSDVTSVTCDDRSLKVICLSFRRSGTLRTRSSLNVCELGLKSFLATHSLECLGNTMLYWVMPKKRHTLMFNVILKWDVCHHVFSNNLFQTFTNVFFLLNIKEDILKTVLGAQQPYINYDKMRHSLGCHSHSYCKLYLHVISTNTHFWSDFIGMTYVLCETFVMV